MNHLVILESKKMQISQITIKDEPVQTVNARQLHKQLGVRRDFSTWIKGRIKEYGFICNVDFITVQNLSSPKRGSAKSRKQVMIDYHITLDMAKELAMVEKSDKGRQIRRYFIECEKRLNDEVLTIGVQLERALLECEHLDRVLSNAGYVLNKGGKQLKPSLLAKIKKLKGKLQPQLPFSDDQQTE